MAFWEVLLCPTDIVTKRDADVIFDIVDTDGSGTIELHELTEHLVKLGYTPLETQNLFQRICDNNDGDDGDGGGEEKGSSVSQAVFQRALLDDGDRSEGGVRQMPPRRYFMNSVGRILQPKGPIDRMLAAVGPSCDFESVYCLLRGDPPALAQC